jgi:hypothetical protein
VEPIPEAVIPPNLTLSNFTMAERDEGYLRADCL